MSVNSPKPGRLRLVPFALLLVGLAAVLSGYLTARHAGSRTATAPAETVPPGLGVDGNMRPPSSTLAPSPQQAPRSAPDPTGVRIPTIGVAAPTIPLGLREDGSIEVPADFDQTGWWADGPEPGEPGPAVILGHVDAVSGPAVFSRLADLAIGDVVHVDREDGTTISYRVDRIEQHPKHDFPTDAVYGRGGDDSVLRLVTCGGAFDREARSYVDNVIVFASMIRS